MIKWRIRTKFLMAMIAVFVVSFGIIFYLLSSQFRRIYTKLLTTSAGNIQNETRLEIESIIRQIEYTNNAAISDRDFLRGAVRVGLKNNYKSRQIIIYKLRIWTRFNPLYSITFVSNEGIIHARGAEPDRFGDKLPAGKWGRIKDRKKKMFMDGDNIFLSTPVYSHSKILGYLLTGYRLTPWINKLKKLTGGEFSLHPLSEAASFAQSKPAGLEKRIVIIEYQGNPFGMIGVLIDVKPIKMIFNVLNRQFRWSLFISWILSILMILIISGGITRPLRKLVEGAQEVSRGSLDKTIEVESSDEVGVLVNTFNDMTRSLKQSRLKLIQSERIAAWREIARRMAHEIKNPLMPIQVSIENIRKLVRNTTQEKIILELTEPVLEEVNALKTLVNEFTRFTRLPPPDKKEYDLNSIVEETTLLYDKNPADVIITAAVPKTENMVLVDKNQIKQVLKNIIQNGIDAAEPGGKIKISIENDNGENIITISDNGIGIDEGNLEKIFTPYWTAKKGGTGLGLPLSAQIINEHNGKIEVESESGRGTVVRIYLPGYNNENNTNS